MTDARSEPARAALARAKVNLTLHVTGRRPDGYHLLESLAVFPRIGDLVEVEPASGIGLTLDGPFGLELGTGPDNLVLRAAEALRDRFAPGAPGAAIRLVKRLPVASGVGGGSSDAAMTLRLLEALWRLRVAPDALDTLALTLGADTPVCLRQPAPQVFRGVGDALAPGPRLPVFWMVLANPGAPLSTAEVFGAGVDFGRSGPPAPAAGFATLPELAAWLAEGRNDMAAAAERLRPSIAEARAALTAQPGCVFARMSGSGATCFGLFETEAAALAAEGAIRRAEPIWWAAAGPVGDPAV